MDNRTRIALGVVVAGTFVAFVTGCASASPAGTATSAPSTRASAVAAPSPTGTLGGPSTSSAPAASPTVSALAQHIYDTCNTGADDAGVVLEFTDNPSGYRADGKYQLIYPIERFTDGHTDPYAVYNCSLSDDTVRSTFLGGGVTDTH